MPRICSDLADEFCQATLQSNPHMVSSTEAGPVNHLQEDDSFGYLVDV